MSNTKLANKYFSSEHFVLRKETSEGANDSVMLWLDFALAEAAIILFVVDYSTGKYDEKYMFDFETESVEEYFTNIEKVYDVKLPSRFVTLSKEFIELAPNSFGIDVDVEDINEVVSCEACGDFSVTGVRAYYFPPINGTDYGTLCASFRGGCYGETVVVGEFSTVKERVIERLDTYADLWDYCGSSDTINEFIKRLEKVVF